MEKTAILVAVATLGLRAMTMSDPAEASPGYRYYGSLAYYDRFAPTYFYSPTLGGRILGQTTTFYNSYVPDYRYRRGSVTAYCYGYAPYVGCGLITGATATVLFGHEVDNKLR